jgi:hypothetical protein
MSAQPLTIVEALEEQCRRFGVPFHHFYTEISAHALLAKLPTGFDEFDDSPRIALQWLEGKEFQAEVEGRPIETGTFEACVTALAARCPNPTPSQKKVSR